MYVAGKVAEKGSFRDLMVQKGHFYTLAESQTYADVEAESDDEDDIDTPAEDKKAKAEGKKEVTRRLSQVPKAPTKQETHEEPVEEEPPKIPMSRLLSYARQKYWMLPIIWLSAILQGAVYPYVGLFQVDAAYYLSLPKEEMKTEIVKVWGGYFVCACIMLLSLLLVSFFTTAVSEQLIKTLRVACLQNLLRQEVGFHDNPKNSAASLGFALRVDTFRVSQQMETMPANLGVLGSLIVGMVLGFTYEWKIVCSMLIFIPIIIGATITQVLLSAGVNSSAIPEAAKSLISESMQNPKTIQALCMEKTIISKYVGILTREDATECQRVKKLMPSGFMAGLSTSLVPFLIAFNIWFIGWLTLKGHAESNASLQAFVSLLWAAMGCGFVASTLGDSSKASKAVSNLFRLIDTKSNIDGVNPDGETPPAGFQPGCIEFKRVVFAYPFRPTVQILKGMSFTIQAGQSVGLVGPSGGGKSTIYGILQRFYDPLEGQCLVGTQRLDLRLVNIRYWRQVIGFVGQEPTLFNTTVRQNITYGAAEGQEVTQAMLDECLQVANLGFLFEKNGAGFDTEVGPKGSRLSGGQKQRVAIARGFIRNPKILLLDEATSALDNTSEKIVSEALERTRQGRTSFSSAHRLSTVEDCDVILVAGEGIILERGSDAELMQKAGIYNKLQALQGKDSVCCA
jgi:ABC-type multidrug transport system fused ATPase/permease subunit